MPTFSDRLYAQLPISVSRGRRRIANNILYSFYNSIQYTLRLGMRIESTTRIHFITASFAFTYRGCFIIVTNCLL